MNLPILINHDYISKRIGDIVLENGRIFIVFQESLPYQDFWDIFPTAGVHILEVEKDKDGCYVKKAEILEFSLMI